jgi:hypothetical protein
MDRTVFAVIKGGSFIGSTVLTNISMGASSDGFPSFSYLRERMANFYKSDKMQLLL